MLISTGRRLTPPVPMGYTHERPPRCGAAGLAGFPYHNGWVEVRVASREEADRKFRARFPDRPGHEGIMNYAFCYNEQRWAEMDPEHTWHGGGGGEGPRPPLVWGV